MEYPNFKVCVRCFTFNQVKYVTDAMNGFTMQQTDFPFVCCIVDDASTDGEQEVIRKYVEENFEFSDGSVAYHKETDYAHITYAQHKTNKNCYFAVLYLKENLYSKKMGYKKMEYLSEWRNCCEYEAICEGDDYWIAIKKLQNQARYLDNHPECSYLFSDRYIDHEKQKIRAEIRYKKDKYTTYDILSGFIPGLQTVMFRRTLSSNPLLQTKGINGDRLYAYTASTMGEIHCLHDITAVYRNSGDGVSTGINNKELFNHTVNDFYRFHKNLHITNRKAYLVGQSQYLREYGVGHNKIYRLLKVFSGFQKIDNSISVLNFICILFFSIKRKILIKYNLTDPYVQQIHK